MEAKSSTPTSNDSNFALEAEDSAEVLELDVDFSGHDECRIVYMRGLNRGNPRGSETSRRFLKTTAVRRAV